MPNERLSTHMPLVFERWSIRAKSAINIDSFIKKRTPYKGSHLFIFQHGLGGDAKQFRLFRNIVKIAVPDCKMLSCSNNEGKTDKLDLATMGKNLADEVFDYLDALQEEDPSFKLARITFVCHSLGGLIVRSALPHLSMLKDKMHGFFSVSVPHLGTIKHHVQVNKIGMWFVKKVGRSNALEQLGLTETSKMEDSKVF